MKNRRNTIAVLSILVLALMGTAAHAVTVERRWDGDNSTNRWGYKTNWTDDTTPNTIFESAVFDGNNGNDIQLDLGVGSSLEIGQIKVVTPDSLIWINQTTEGTASALTLTPTETEFGNVGFDMSQATKDFGFAAKYAWTLVIGSDQRWDITSTSETGGDFQARDATNTLDTNDNALEMNVGVGRTLLWNGVISGTGSITKIGDGTLALGNGNNSFTGGFTVNNGLVTLNGGGRVIRGNIVVDALADDSTELKLLIANAFDRATSTLTMQNNGTFNMNGLTAGVATVILTDGTISGGSASILSMENDIAVSKGTIDVALANVDGDTVGLTKTGVGTVVLSQANTYNGLTTVSEGVLEFGVDDAVSLSSGIFLTGGGTINTGGFDADLIATLDISGSGTIDFNSFGTTALSFADSSLTEWESELAIVNFTEGDTIQFGVDGNGLTATQLSEITINGEAVQIDESGFVTAVPEPATLSLLALGGIAMLKRRKHA